MLKRYILIVVLFLFETFLSYAQTGLWSGKIDVQGTKLTLVFHFNEENPVMDSPDQGVKGIPIQITRGDIGTVTIKIPSIGAKYEGLWILKQIVGSFTQFGESLPLTLTPGTEKPNRPQTPVGPFPYAMEDVSFVNGNAVLKGTLVLPDSCTRKTPVFIMITGSGLQNRDEEIYEHKPFAVIADALARAGIATLRYDDRGYGESTGDIINFTIEDLKNDAIAGIELLRERFDKVGVIGHSEGGTIALMLAAEKKADYIVSLAGMVVSGKETLLWQNRIALAATGYSEETIDDYCSLLADAFDAIINNLPIPSAENAALPSSLKLNYQSIVSQFNTPYIKDFLIIDTRRLLNQIECPVLAINGTNDTQVEAISNIDALSTILNAHSQNRFVMVDGVNHLFQHCVTGAPTEYYGNDETFAPDVLEIIVEWIQNIHWNAPITASE